MLDRLPNHRARGRGIYDAAIKIARIWKIFTHKMYDDVAMNVVA